LYDKKKFWHYFSFLGITEDCLHFVGYCILFTFDLHAGTRKFHKNYLFSMGLWKHLNWRGATRSSIETLEVLFRSNWPWCP